MKPSITNPSNNDIKKMISFTSSLFLYSNREPVLTIENVIKLMQLDKNIISCYKKNGELISWSIVFPTSKKVLNSFLKEKPNEQKIFLSTIKDKKFEALYVFVIVTVSEYRKKGLSYSLLKNQIEYFNKKYNSNIVYSWNVTKEGKLFMNSFKEKMSKKSYFSFYYK